MSTRRRSEDDFRREVAAHIDLETERLIADGMAPEDARVAARRRFGNVTAARERFHEARTSVSIERFVQDLRCAVRNMQRYPVASLIAILSLAVGLGATTVSLTIRDVIFHRPPATYQQPDQLSKIQIGSPENPLRPSGNPVPVALYARWRASIGPSIAAHLSLGERDARVSDRTESVRLHAVTPELFATLGVAPLVGRTFADGDASASEAASSAILSHLMWQRLFDQRQDVVGQVVWIDDRAYTVIGVMPEAFWLGDMDSPIWSVLTTSDMQRLPASTSLDVIARASPGMSRRALEQLLQPALAEYSQHLPAAQRQLALRASGLEGTPMGGQISFVLPYVLGTAVLLTLLIACANVAILMIAQWTAREHEIAIRASIGASRARIIRLLLTESILIAACGGALGIGATALLQTWIIHQSGGGPSLNLSIDFRIFFQAAAIALVAGIVAGLAPALYETRRLHVNPLRTIATSDRVRQRWRNALVVFEISVTIALLVVTSTMVDGYLRARHADVGYATQPLLNVRVDNPKGVPTTRVLEILRGVPGVAAAGATRGSRQETSNAPAGGTSAAAERAEITSDYFRALGVQMRAGRAFSRADSTSSGVAIVNQTLASLLFQGGDPIGARLWVAKAPYQIVGVVSDYTLNPIRANQPEPRVFVPVALDATDVTRLTFLVRAEENPAALVQRLRQDIRGAGPGTTVPGAETVDQVIRIMSQEMMVATAPLFPLIVIGLMLTTAGIYGVLAFAIARRSRELAVRIAVGAGAGDVVKLITAQTVRLVSAGAVVGLLLMLGLTRLVRSNGGAGSIWDPPLVAFLIPMIVLVVVGAIATWVPARRALKIDPVTLLRAT